MTTQTNGARPDQAEVPAAQLQSQRAIIEARIAQYEAQRDQALANANQAQGAALALRELLAEMAP